VSFFLSGFELTSGGQRHSWTNLAYPFLRLYLCVHFHGKGEDCSRIGSCVSSESCHSQSEHGEQNHLPPSSHLASDPVWFVCERERDRANKRNKKWKGNSSCCGAVLIITCCKGASWEEYIVVGIFFFNRKRSRISFRCYMQILYIVSNSK